MLSDEKQRHLRQQFNPDGSQLREAQLRIVDMLLFLDGICRRHGLRYWIDSGTLLGAMRHGGFIPWDDDADVCMPREDMLRLRDILLHEEHHEHYVLQCRATDPGHTNPWVVLRDKRSFYWHTDGLLSEHDKRYRGLQVDIFPMEEGVSQPLHRMAAQLHRRLLLNPALQRRGFGWLRPMAPALWGMLTRVVYPVFRRMGRRLSDGDWEKGYGIPFESRHPKDDIFPLSTVAFEDVTLACPARPDKYLTAMYGAWEDLPQEHQCQGHQVTLITN